MSNDDPLNYDEAVHDEKWIKAMKNEMNVIEKNNTWELVTLPAHAKKVGVKWIYKSKLNKEGKVDKYKVRLVAKGYTQTKGINYNEVFALVARWDIVRIVLAVAAQEGWNVYQLDVKGAFLYGELKEEVYVNQPKGFIKHGEEDKVYKLNKALYGLKQAPRTWFSRIESYFQKEGFTKSRHDYTLFVKKKEEKMIMVCVYFDDLIYVGNDEEMCSKFKKSMKEEFEMTDLGMMRYFLGVEVSQNANGIYLCQKKYARDVMERFKMMSCNSVKNPIVPGIVL